MTNKEFCFCIERLQRNDMRGLSALYEDYFQKIKFYALSFTKDIQSAYDIAMNVMVKMIDFDGDPNQIKNHVAYLMAIAKNESLNFIKQNLRNTQINFEICNGAQFDENTLWLNDILDTLNEEEREVFVSHCIWGINLRDIAKQRQKSYPTIIRIYTSIKNKIKDIYN